MKTLAQINNGKVALVKDYEDHIEFASNIMVVDVTHVEPKPLSGWLYNDETKQFSQPPPQVNKPTITIDAKVNGKTFTSAALGSTAIITASFSDKSLNFDGLTPETSLLVSVCNREGQHRLNLNMKVVNGEALPTDLLLDERGDYCVTHAGINHYKDKINAELRLKDEIVVRVDG